MTYKVFNSYGGFSLEVKNEKLHYLDIVDKKVKTPKGDEGYIRIVGTNNIYEHGYSATEDIYKIITLDYRVINIPSELEII